MLNEFSLSSNRGQSATSLTASVRVLEELEDRSLMDATAVAGPVISSADGVLKLDGVPFRSVGYTDFSAVAETVFYDNRATYFNRLTANGVNTVRVWLSHPWSASDSPFTKKDGKYNIAPDPNKSESFNQSYFDRLKTFVSDAAARGVVVTLTLFNGSELTGNSFKISPYNPANNKNGLGSQRGFADSTGDLWTKSHAPLIDKVADTLKGFGNVIYQIANEPDSHYMGDTAGKDFHVAVIGRLKEKLFAGVSVPVGYAPVFSVNITDAAQLTPSAAKPDHAADDGQALREWTKTSADVGLIEVHFVSAHTEVKKDNNGRDVTVLAENSPANFFSKYRALDKPIVFSDDGDITCLTASQLKGRPYAKPTGYDRNEYLRDKFVAKAVAGASAWGHVGIEVDDKGINGSSWGLKDPATKTNYEARVANVDLAILRILKPLQSPTAPSRMTVQVIDRTTVDVRWTDHSVNETRFVIKYSTDGKNFRKAGKQDGDPDQLTSKDFVFRLNNLKPNTVYWIRVVAENDFGSGMTDQIKVKTKK